MSPPKNQAPPFNDGTKEWLNATIARSSPQLQDELLQQLAGSAPPPYSEDGTPTRSQAGPYHYQGDSASEDFLEANPFQMKRGATEASRYQSLPQTPSPRHEIQQSYQSRMNLQIQNPQSSVAGLQGFPSQQIQQMEHHRENYLASPSLPKTESPVTDQADKALLSQTLAFISSLPPPPLNCARLSHPILIPQCPPGRGLGTSPFVRAWAPCLSSYALTLDNFLSFLDNLNIISTASPPLQVLDLVGGAIGMVPYHWAQIAGAAVQTSAQIGTKLVSKGRTDAFLKQVNARIFSPRGLRVRIVKGVDMPRELRMTEGSPILSHEAESGLLERVLKGMQPYSETLVREDLPAPEGQKGILDKWSARQVEKDKAKSEKKAVKAREKVLKKQEKKVHKHKKDRRKEKRREKRDKKHKKQHEDSSDSSSSSSSESEEDPVGLQVSERVNIKILKEKTKWDEKQEKEAKKLLWVMIENMSKEHIL